MVTKTCEIAIRSLLPNIIEKMSKFFLDKILEFEADRVRQQENLFNDFLRMWCAAELKNIQHLPEWDQLSERGLLISLDSVHQCQIDLHSSNKTS